jgi:S1-C subfamily serine protease
MSNPVLPQPKSWLKRLQTLSATARRAVPFALGICITFAALLLYNLIFPGTPPLTAQQVNDTVAQAMASATPAPAYSARAYQAIQYSLVLIQAHIPDAPEDKESSLGSGVVVTENGDILTSLHVVANASEITVVFADGTQSAAQVVLEQPENDIAVLMPDQLPDVLVPAILGNPNAMRVGDETFAVGNPFGLYSSMSSGVISGFERSFQPPNSDQVLEGLIQIDAAVNPGNSGGPLLNRYGQVVGIVTGIINPTEENFFVGIGFAVPITVAVGGMGGGPAY